MDFKKYVPRKQKQKENKESFDIGWATKAANGCRGVDGPSSCPTAVPFLGPNCSITLAKHGFSANSILRRWSSVAV